MKHKVLLVFKRFHVFEDKFDLSRTFDVSYKVEILERLRNMGVDVFHIRATASLLIIVATLKPKTASS